MVVESNRTKGFSIDGIYLYNGVAYRWGFMCHIENRMIHNKPKTKQRKKQREKTKTFGNSWK